MHSGQSSAEQQLNNFHDQSHDLVTFKEFEGIQKGDGETFVTVSQGRLEACSRLCEVRKEDGV